MDGTQTRRQIAIVVYPGVQSLDFAGPLEVFAGAQRLIEESGRRERGYEVKLLSADGEPLESSSGLTVTPHASLARTPAAIDTLIVAGGYGREQAAADPVLLEWIRRTSKTARRTASVCTGAFLLAEAGLLTGRRATTHWKSHSGLAQQYPDVEVDPDPIYIRDGRIWTSAGITAGIDLSLALIQEDLGRKVAMQVARHLVVFLNRPGGQAQFSAPLEAQTAAANGNAPNRFTPLHDWVAENVAGDLRVERLAEQAGMSPRTFARVYTAKMGTTPARMVERIRIEAVRRNLEESDTPIKQIATLCGFGQEERLRRAFGRQVGTTPAEYRRRF